MFERIKSLFKDGEKTYMPLYSPHHLAAKEIAEAEMIAMDIIGSQTTGVIKTRSFNTDDYHKLKKILDCAILKCTDDPNLFYARACATTMLCKGKME